MDQKKFEAHIESLKKLNERAVNSIVSGGELFNIWIAKKFYRLKFLVAFGLFRIRHPRFYSWYANKKLNDRFIMRMFYIYTEGLFILRPLHWLLLFEILPTTILRDSAVHMIMRLNHSDTSKKRRRKLFDFVKELVYYRTLNHLWILAEHKQRLLKQKADELLTTGKVTSSYDL